MMPQMMVETPDLLRDFRAQTGVLWTEGRENTIFCVKIAWSCVSCFKSTTKTHIPGHRPNTYLTVQSKKCKICHISEIHHMWKH